MTIQKITSPGGIEAWLVEEHSVPLISMRFGFLGGSSQDADDKMGLAYFVSGMLDEGAGELDSAAFQEAAEELAMRMSFDASRDSFTGNFQTLSANSEKSFALLKMAITSPRFDQPAIERIRKQILSGLRFDLNDPSKVAARAWFALAFGDHPYSRPTKGNVETLNSINAQDLRDYVGKVFARDTLKVAVVGDIDAKTLGRVLDEVFGSLPAKSELKEIPEAVMLNEGKREVISMEIPQSVAQFGLAGIKRKDPDFIPAYILNYIVGGGGFSSQLMKEVREKRGLAYSVHSYLYPYQKGAAYIGGVATQNKNMGQSLSVIRDELQRIVTDGITADELKSAKQYLTGSYPLRFDSNSKIATQLLWLQLENFDTDYIDNRNDMINAVKLEDIQRVAKRLLRADGLIVTIVGKPEGLREIKIKEKAETPG